MKSLSWKNPIVAIILVCVVLVGSLVIINQAEGSVYEGMPNYTEYKDPIEVDGFNYESQPRLGSDSAEVKVIEFADFKCPACKSWSENIFPKLKAEYIDTGKIQFYFANYAFIDRDSLLAASAGEAIYAQSNEAFWEYNKLLYENQGDESEVWATQKFLLNFVKKNVSGIDHKKFEQDLKNNSYFGKVKEDFKIGGFYGVNGTPTLFVNGMIVRSSMDYNEIKKEIDKALDASVGIGDE